MMRKNVKSVIGIKKTCNWCGSDKLKFIGCSYFGPHPHPKIYKCKKCRKQTAFCFFSTKFTGVFK